MREIKYLSPTSIDRWTKDRDAFYLAYLADNRPPRFPQTQPMAIGSAFDAYVKSYLYYNLIGDTKGTPFDFQNLFDTQVEEHNREWAMTHGGYVFSEYRGSGALADLVLMLKDSVTEPRFETTLEATVEGIPFLGKPDIFFNCLSDVDAVHDWKVNGYCSKGTTSPKKGYVALYESDGYKLGPHKDVQLVHEGGVYANIAHTLEQVDIGWAKQLAIYSWLLGAPVGSKFLVMIDQIVAKDSGHDFPILRTATHRCFISKAYQYDLMNQCKDIWTRCHSQDRIFYPDCCDSRAESVARCEILDIHYRGYEDDESKYADWFDKEIAGRDTPNK